MNVHGDDHACPRRILVVDDDPIFREMMSYALSQFHIEVKTANNGAEALNMIQEEPFDVLLVDFQMPEMNGLEVATAARRLHLTLPIALVTGSVGTFSSLELDAAGVNRFFTKPFNLEELMSWIDGRTACRGNGLD